MRTGLVRSGGRGARVRPGRPEGRPVRYRLRLARRGAARFLSHLDGLRALLRALRRSGLPVALSQGYNPHLKIAFGSALALGLESEAEFVDVEMTEPVRLTDVAARLAAVLPPGFELREVRGAPVHGKALASYQAVSRYVARPLDGPVSATGVCEDVRERVSQVLERASLEVERRPGKNVNLRPLIASLEADARGSDDGAACLLKMELSSGPAGTARADEVLALLGLDPAGWSLLKTDFWPLVRGSKVSPWEA